MPEPTAFEAAVERYRKACRQTVKAASIGIGSLAAAADKEASARAALLAMGEGWRPEKSIDNPMVPEYIILANARRICGTRFKTLPNWSLAMEIFGLGSNWARALCERAGVDPDSKIVTPPITALHQAGAGR